MCRLIPIPQRASHRSLALLASMLRRQAAILAGEGDHDTAKAMRSRAGSFERSVCTNDLRRCAATLTRTPAHA